MFTKDEIIGKLPEKAPEDYTNGFTYILNSSGYDANSFMKETRYQTATPIYSLIRGTTKLPDIKYKDLEMYAEIFNFQSVDDLVGLVRHIEDKWGVVSNRIRGGKVDSIQQILEYQRSHGRLSEEKCEEIAYHAKMKTKLRRAMNSIAYLDVLKESCEKLHIWDEMETMHIPELKDYLGNVIVTTAV